MNHRAFDLVRQCGTCNCSVCSAGHLQQADTTCMDGAAFAEQASVVLSIVAVGFGLLALNITGHYALLALGQVRLVAMLNLVGGLAMLAVVTALTPRVGLLGAAVGRLLYGPITSMMYFRLCSMLSPRSIDNAFLVSTATVVEPGSR